MAKNNHRDLIERLALYQSDSDQDRACVEASEVIEHFEDIVRQINTWCDTYPKFVEPTKKQWLDAHNLLNKAKGCSLVAISGSRRQHVIDGIEKIING